LHGSGSARHTIDGGVAFIADCPAGVCTSAFTNVPVLRLRIRTQSNL
jgi:hypothetical protein